MDIDAFKDLFERYTNDPSTINQEKLAEIDAMLDHFDAASADQAAHLDAGGTRTGWLTGVLKEVFGEELPPEFLEYGESVLAAAKGLVGLAEHWTASVITGGLEPDVVTSNPLEALADVILPSPETVRGYKRAGAAALHEVTGSKVPLEACVAIADMGVETVVTAAEVALGRKTPLEGLSHLADRAVAIVGAIARTATVIGAAAAGTAIGAYLGNPALGKAVGQQVGQAIAPAVGALVEQGVRKLVPHAKRKLAGIKKSAGKILKKVNVFAFGG
ncbi:MAG: hypothetical protein VX475_24405 [Myxococcota bacterium]|nr:hypothetical protein [Myxococcota bacterium]